MLFSLRSATFANPERKQRVRATLLKCRGECFLLLLLLILGRAAADPPPPVADPPPPAPPAPPLPMGWSFARTPMELISAVQLHSAQLPPLIIQVPAGAWFSLMDRTCLWPTRWWSWCDPLIIQGGSVTIVGEGEGATLDGERHHPYSMFEVRGGNLTVQNMQLVNASKGVVKVTAGQDAVSVTLDQCGIMGCSSGYGTVVRVDKHGVRKEHAASIHVTKCSITSCSADFYGGVVYVGSSTSSPTSVYLEECPITSCFARADCLGLGGVIYIFSPWAFVHLNQCPITSCSAQNGGVVYVEGGAVHLKHCPITKCSAQVRCRPVSPRFSSRRLR